MNYIEEIQDTAYGDGYSAGWNDGLKEERLGWYNYLRDLTIKYEGSPQTFFNAIKEEVDEYFEKCSKI